MMQEPTKKQKDYAFAISNALRDGADLCHMSKMEMSNYISKSLSSEENRRKLHEYNSMIWIHNHNERMRKLYGRAYLSDESLGGDWGLDANDFGMQSWGDS